MCGAVPYVQNEIKIIKNRDFLLKDKNHLTYGHTEQPRTSLYTAVSYYCVHHW